MGQGRKVIAAVAASAALGLILTASGSAWSIFLAEQGVAKWRAGFRVSLVRTPALPRSRREEVGSLARVYARFAPTSGEDPKHGESARLPRPTRAGTQWPVGNGSTRAENGPCTTSEAPLLWNFATACRTTLFTQSLFRSQSTWLGTPRPQ